MSTSLIRMHEDLTKRTRPSEFEYGLMQAIVTASRSTCSRAKNGAVITAFGRVLSSGYNGALAGQEHCNHECDCGITAEAIKGHGYPHFSGCASTQPCTKSIHAE